MSSRGRERVRNFVVETWGESAKIVYDFPVLQHDWEGDGWGWVVDVKGEKKLVLTNDNDPYVAKPSELQEKLDYYNNVRVATSVAMQMLK